MKQNEKIIRNEQEAIEAIKSNMPTSGYYMLRESLEMAIKALEEVQEYRKLGTVEEVREAVGKDTAKKVIIKPWEPCKCPTCDKELSESVGDGYYKHYYYLKRCPECGQRLNWGD